MLRFDESTLAERLARAGMTGRCVFSCACAESLIPCYLTFSAHTGEGTPEVLENALSDIWDAIAAGSVPVDLKAREDSVALLVPDEEEFGFDSGLVAANAAAATSYALRSWRESDPISAVWSGRQIYEAADYLAHSRMPEVDFNSPMAATQIAAHPIVQDALAHLQLILGASVGIPDRLRERSLADLRALCVNWGVGFARNLEAY